MKTISGTFVTHEKTFRGTLSFTEEGFIEKLDSIPNESADFYFPPNCLIFPGFNDIHIHAREDVSQKHVYKEDFVSAGEAAINGGVVHVADMPNNPIPPIDDSSYKEKLHLTHKSRIHITLYAGIGPSTNPLSSRVPYKVFMGPSIGELYFRDNESLEKTLERYKGCDVSFHCEDPIILEKNKDQKTHEQRRPVEAETTATEFAIYLTEKYNLRSKLCHYSSGQGLDLIRKAKAKGLPVTCEVTPTHLLFSVSDLTEENHKWFQMNPPLRQHSDKLAMLAGVKDGTVDFLATDHAPHSIEEKLKGTSGISQLDTYSLFVTYLILTLGVDLQTVCKIASTNPGIFTNQFLDQEKFKKGYGFLEKDYLANFTVLNLTKPHVFQKSEIKSKSGWSPFENFAFPGSLEAVFVKGKRLKA